MKNQNDLIMRIVAIVLALIACGVIIYNQPQPVQPPDPERVPEVKLQLPAGTVVKSNGLPGGGGQGSEPGAGFGGGIGSGPGAGSGAAAPQRGVDAR